MGIKRKIGRRLIAVVMAAVVIAGMPLSAEAREWFDGTTPDDQNNRITTDAGVFLEPTVATNFYVRHFSAVLPVTPKSIIDRDSGVSESSHKDACSIIYICDNNQYGPLAAEVLDNAVKDAGVQKGDAITIDLMRCEDKTNTHIDQTEDEIEFVMSLPKGLVNKDREFALLRVNSGGTVTFLTDLDQDNKTLTFRTDRFGEMSLFCLVYGERGCFDAYKPAEEAVAIDQMVMSVQADIPQ